MIIRYSMIQSWLECPKAFYDRYILEKLELEKSAALEFGTALHLGIRNILDGEDGNESFLMYWNTLKDTRMKYFEHGWGDLKDLGEHFLGNFKSRHAKKFSDFEQEVQMEMPFLYNDSPGAAHGKHTLQGTADYIGMYEGKLTIVDWKTSSRTYKKNKILLNPQMYIYAKLYQNKTGKLPEQIMYKVFNKKDGNINTIVNPLTQLYVDAIFESIEHAATGMLRSIETKQLWHGADCYCPRF